MVSQEHICDANPEAAWNPGTVAVTGGHLAYHRTGGCGPSLVLSHGLTDNGLCWSRTAQALCGDFDVIMLDARGHGASSRILPGQDFDPARDLAEAIAGLDLEAPIVMGHSVGASATAAFANANPSQVARVVLEDPPFVPETTAADALRRRDGFRRQIAELQALSDDALTAFGRETAPLWHESEFPAWVLGKRQVDSAAYPLRVQPWQATVEGIAAPTLLLYGDVDRGGLITPEVAREAKRLNPLIEAVRIAGAGHNIRRENFTDYLDAVRTFLLKVSEVSNPAD